MAPSADPILIELNNNYCSSVRKWVKRKLGCTVASSSTVKTKAELLSAFNGINHNQSPGLKLASTAKLLRGVNHGEAGCYFAVLSVRGERRGGVYVRHDFVVAVIA